MAEPFKYIFKIDGKYTIDTLPMERLADYMADLAKMLGQPERVHFIELRQSSVGLVHVVERESNRAVETRIMELQRGAADLTTMAAYRALDKKLRADDSFASYFPEWASQNDQNVLVLQFPGKLGPEPVIYSGIPQLGSIDGTIIRVGGVRDEIPVTVQIEEGLFCKCVASKTLAKELAKHLFEGELRLHGNGKWARDEHGVWTLQRFQITSFELLDSRPLLAVINDLRSLHVDWDSDDLWQAAKDLRDDLH